MSENDRIPRPADPQDKAKAHGQNGAPKPSKSKVSTPADGRSPSTSKDDRFGPDHLLNDPNNFPTVDGKSAHPGSPSNGKGTGDKPGGAEEPPAAWKDGTQKKYLPNRSSDGRKNFALWDPKILGWYKTISEVAAEILAELSARQQILQLFEDRGKLHIREEQDTRVAPWPLFLPATEEDLRGIIDRACVFYDRPKSDEPPIRLREPWKPAVKDLTKRRYDELRGQFGSVIDERLKYMNDPIIVAVVAFVKDWAKTHNGDCLVKKSSEFYDALIDYLKGSKQPIPPRIHSAAKLTEALDGQDDTLRELGVDYFYHRSGKSRTVTAIWIG